jgi:endonuclease YncB( thermonuclease family)
LGLLTAVAFASSILNCETPPGTLVVPVEVVRCYDGDTCTLKTKEKIRLAGIDAPEKKGTLGGKGQLGSQEAKLALSEKVIGQKVSLIKHGFDRYGRTVGEFCDGSKSINVWLVEQGYARVYRGKESSKSIDHNLFNDAETKAKKDKLGVWSSQEGADGHEDPAVYRKKLKSKS